MKKLNLNLLIAFILSSGIQKLTAQDTFPDPNGTNCVPTVSSFPCVPAATTWYLGGNVIPTGGLTATEPCFKTNIGTCNNSPFILKANNVPSIFIQPSSFVGIGANNAWPAAALDIRNTDLINPTNQSNFRIYADAAGNLESTSQINLNFATGKTFKINEGAANTGINAMTILSGGNVGIGTSNPQYNLDVTGSIRSSGLSGIGNRMVVTDPLGELSWQVLPNLSISGINLSISNGNTVALPVPNLSISGNNISISGGNTITLPVTSAPIPQVLAITGSNITLSGGGGNVTVPSSADNLGNHNATLALNMNGNSLNFLGGVSGGPSMIAVAGGISVTTDLLPHNSFTSPYNLGSSSYRWHELFCTNATINTSDIRFKTNIKDLNYGLKELMKLRTITYNWKQNDNGTRIGLIAQELKEVISEVVTIGDDENKSLGVRYTELIPVLINAIKEQQLMIEEQNSKIDALLSGSNKTTSLNNTIQSESVSAVLFQNNPNPFNESTEIKYNIPSTYGSSSIIICDLSGKLLKTIHLYQKGSSSIKINAGELRPGILIYSLIIDGKEIANKRMVITE